MHSGIVFPEVNKWLKNMRTFGPPGEGIQSGTVFADVCKCVQMNVYGLKNFDYEISV